MNDFLNLFGSACDPKTFSCILVTDCPIILGIILRTLIVYIAILFMLRLAGKRQVGQMTPFDFVLLLLLSNSVQNAMTGGDNSLNGGIIAAVTLMVTNWLVNYGASKNRTIRKLVEGSPTKLIVNGVVIGKNLRREGIDQDQLEQAFREHSIADLSEVGLAVLEIDGSISVLKKDELPADHPPNSHLARRLKFLKRTKKSG